MNNLYSLGFSLNIVSDIFRSISFFLDGLIYGLIPVVYDVIYSMYDFTKVLSTDASMKQLFETVSSTIYSFLAIFMFFRVAFSLITMLVDPSVIDDRERGAKKIITNIMICLLLIVFVPKIFEYSKTIQSRVMEQHLIERIVTGKDFSDNYSFGNEFALSLWGLFFYPADDGGSAAEAYRAVFDNPANAGKVWPLSKLALELNNVSGGALGVLGGLIGGDNATYCLSYVYIISTLVGIYALWTFLKLMIDIGYRSIKFFALELLSPIAIVSYIDPSSSKKGMFSKWLNESVKTYASLFIRVFVFAFASVILRNVSLGDISGNIVVKIIYSLAILAFIKMAPKFIDDLFGTSISKGSDTKFASDFLGGLMGFAAAGTAGAFTGGYAAKKAGVNPVKGALSGAWSAGTKGFKSGQKGGISAIPGVVSAGYGSYADANKKYGLNIDPEEEKLINSLKNKVPDVDAAKANALDNLMANGRQEYNRKIKDGAKVNGRKYGRGIENDEGLENILKKNAAGLAKDEVLHAGDDEYLTRRRYLAKVKDEEAIVARTSALASTDYSSAESSYQNSSDKKAYFVSFGTETGKMKYDGMDDKELKESFTSELSKHANNQLQTQVSAFTAADRNLKIDMVANVSGLDRASVMKMDESQLTSTYNDAIIRDAKASFDSEFERFSKSSRADKIQLSVNKLRDNLTYESSSVDESVLDGRFEKLNDERITVKYGNSITNIKDDAAKISSDVKQTQENLDKYLNGSGKKAKKIDAAYASAESRYKAQKYKETNEKKNNNN